MAAGLFPEVIDLLYSSSDDDDDDGIGLPLMPYRRAHVNLVNEDEAEGGAALPGSFPAERPPITGAPPAEPNQERRVAGGMILVLDGEEIFIPDEEPPAGSANARTAPIDRAANADVADEREFTADDCLKHVLEIFPDISHDHLRSLYASFDHANDFEILAGRARLDNIVEQLVSSTTYPKQEKGKLKRKREDSIQDPIDAKKWERADRAVVPNWAKGSIAAICKADFPIIPRTHINERLTTHLYLFPTYVALAKDFDDSEEGSRIFGRGRATKATTADADTIAVNCGHIELVEELAAARLQVVAVRSQRDAARVKKRAEDDNLRKAIAAGETAECSACFDDLPMNRQIHCDGNSAHFTCFDCAETYIKTEVGDSRCRVLCPAGCGAGFAHNQLDLLENKQLLEKLAQIQQEKDIRDAGLEDLEDCPFCDYKAIMPPIDEDFEFRCANPECEKVSCRRCKAISHVPISCEQHAKDNKLSSRHQIEEAMTAALVRSCNQCKKQFIKESGCNKMHCMSCGTLQCYVCSATVTDYNHFDQGPGHRGRTVGGAQSKKCPLYDNVEERHEREVKEAETKARAEVVENNPDISAEDLEIKVSDAVKKAENDRLQRAGGGVAGLNPFEVVGGGLGQLRRVMGFGQAVNDQADLADAEGAGNERRRQQQQRALLMQQRVRQRLQQRQQQQLERLIPRAPPPQDDFYDEGFGARWRDDEAVDEDDLGFALFGQGGRDRPAAAAAPRPQGFIPVYFGDGQQYAQQGQQAPQAPPAQQAGFGHLAQMGDYMRWPGLFDGMVGGYNPPQAQQQPQPVGNAAVQHNAAANNVQNPNQNAIPNRPGAFGRGLVRPYGGPADNYNPYVPGAFPNARPAAKARPALNNDGLGDFEVLRMQHEQIERVQQRQQNAQNPRRRQLYEEVGHRNPQWAHGRGDRLPGAGAGR